jgi:hypothetical protein
MSTAPRRRGGNSPPTTTACPPSTHQPYYPLQRKAPADPQTPVARRRAPWCAVVHGRRALTARVRRKDFAQSTNVAQPPACLPTTPAIRRASTPSPFRRTPLYPHVSCLTRSAEQRRSGIGSPQAHWVVQQSTSASTAPLNATGVQVRVAGRQLQISGRE